MKKNNNSNQDDDPSNNRNSKSQNQVPQLQEQLAQATMRIHDLEAELKRVRKVNNSSLNDELTDGHDTAKLTRAKLNMVYRITQMEEKSHETEKNAVRMQSDETMLINDFRTVLSELNSLEKLDLVRGALKALESENERHSEADKHEKSDFNEKFQRPSVVVDHQSSIEFNKPNFDVNTENHKRHERFIEASSNRESELCKKVEELEEENNRLFASIEILDQQHEESLEKLLSMKKELEKKHQCLQNAYEELYVDYRQAQDSVAELQGKFTDSNRRIQTETVSCSVQTENFENVQEKHVQTNVPQMIEDKIVQTNDPEMIEHKIVQTNDPEMIEHKIVQTNDPEMIEHKIVQTNDPVMIEHKIVQTNDPVMIEHKIVQTNDPVMIEHKIVQTNISEMIEHKIVQTNDPEMIENKIVQTNDPEMIEDKIVQTNDPEVIEDKIVQTDDREMIEEKNVENDVDELTKRVKDILKNSSVETEEGESIFEAVAKQYIDLKWKKDVLERKVLELTKELKEIAEVKDSLQIECRMEKSMTYSLLHELQEIQDLKLNLYSIPEANEERVVSLETETESLHDEVKLLESENAALRMENAVLQGAVSDETLLESQDQSEAAAQCMKPTRLEDIPEDVEETVNAVCERCKRLDENAELVEELKLELQNMRQGLKTVVANERSTGDRLRDLQEQLDKATREKLTLERSMFNIREELDDALNQLDMKQTYILELSEENIGLKKRQSLLHEELTEENNSLKKKQCSLHEQLSDMQYEYENKIDLLNIEKIDLEEMIEIMNADLVRLEESYEHLRENIKKEEELKYNSKISTLTEKLSSVENDHARLSNEVETLRLREGEFAKLQENFAKVTEEARTLESEYETIKDNCKKLENEMMCLQTEKRELLSRLNEHVCDNDMQQIVALLEEKTRENEALKIDNRELSEKLNDSQRKLQDTIDEKIESASMAKETMQNTFHLIKEKDEKIDELNKLLKLAKDDAQMLEHFATIKNERDELVKLVTIKHNESVQYHGEIQKLSQSLTEQATMIRSLLEERDTVLNELKEKNAELLWTKNELQAVHQRLRNAEESNSKETCGIVEHSTQTSEIAILKEKCNALEAALIQEQSNNRMLQNQFNESQSKEANAGKELERLRAHLVEMESSYTEEALLAEETRKELEVKLQQAEEKMKSSSTAYTSVNIRANQQVETLQQQMALIVQQRDDIQNKLSAAEDKILSQTASLSNLQIVLEQFQRDKEKDIIAATERIHSKLTESYKRQEELAIDVTNLKEQLTEAKECLQAASRLSEQLDKKTERIQQLSQEVDRLTNLVNTADRRIEEAKQSGEGKVDKTLVKNLLLGFLSSPAADKSSVLRVFSTVLDFSETEKDKAGLNNAAVHNSWFSRLSGESTVSNKDQEASLSAAFVRFLENESKPKPQLPALPIQTSSLSRPGHSRQHSTSSTQSTLLLSNVNLPTFPDFVPPRNTGSILKEVLKDS
ncbi:Thyroid receptor-interacting protein 11 [Habropoda laboriosa]|uniref:Thyroid receptor-interacting protein 11 n=1 Tax=Habropoda laboriosa TaxID=597456 RepID=A0A0L7RH02_9HYME|nr:Thyroid receptor-interacting protein 11 [Habropoda laboriosa]